MLIFYVYEIQRALLLLVREILIHIPIDCNILILHVIGVNCVMKFLPSN